MKTQELTTPALRIKTIAIDSMPGLEDGDLKLPELHPNINIIYGPNSSGKSSISRAIRLLLRHTDKTGIDFSVSGELVRNEKQLRIKHRYGRVTTEQNGKPETISAQVPKDMEHRYILSLHQLLADDEDNNKLSERFLKEASGYDLKKALKDLSYNPTRPNTKKQDFDDAKAAVAETDREDQAIYLDEKKLPELMRRLQEARRAETEVGLLGQALKYHDALDARNDAKEALSSFQPGMDKLQGTEIQRLADIHDDLSIHSDAKDQAEESQREAEKVIKDSPLKSEVEKDELDQLESEVTKLQDFERAIETAAQEVNGAREKRDHALNWLGADVQDVEKLKSLNHESTRKLLGFVERSIRYQTDHKHLEKIHDWLAPIKVSITPEKFITGRNALEGWKSRYLSAKLSKRPGNEKTPVHKNPISYLYLITALSLLAFVLSASLLKQEWLWVPVALLVAQALLLLRLKQKPEAQPETDHPPEHYIDAYSKTGLRTPEDWTIPEVDSLLEKLQGAYAKTTLEKEKQATFSGEKTKIAELQERKKTLDEEREELKRILGFAWEEGEDSSISFWLAHLNSLAEARTELSRAQGTEEETCKQYNSLLQQTSSTFMKYEIPEVDSYANANASLNRLRKLQEEYSSAEEALETAQRTISLAERQILSKQDQEKKLYVECGLEPGPESESELKARIDALKTYTGKRDVLLSKESDLRALLSPLRERMELTKLSKPDIEGRKAEQQELAEKAEKLNADKIEINIRIDDAKDSNDDEKHALVEKCTEELEKTRKENQEAAVGELLVKFVRRQNDQTDKTGILKKAKELFIRFTMGRYELDLDYDGETARFICKEDSKFERSLEELSSGTRIQLLLAVRIAFVEHQEPDGLKIPFILDEVLANSDEQRAVEIIKAAISIARSGRQIFYLTAQHDEVIKWKRVLKKEGLQIDHVDLAKIRRFLEKDQIREIDYPEPTQETVPDPENMSHMEYREVLTIRSIDPWENVGVLHLWYVIEDTGTLHKLLSDGYNRWGQLDNLVRNNQSDHFTRDSLEFKRAAASAHALESALNLNRTGKGKPVTAPTLSSFDSIKNSSKIEEIIELAEACGGDGKLLIEGLEARKVPNLLTSKTQQLEIELKQEGFIDSSDELSPEQIKEAVLKNVDKEIGAGLLTPDRVNCLIQQVLRDEQ